MKPILTLLLCAGFALPAGDPAGFHVWKAAELQGIAKALAPKLNGGQTATQAVPGVGNYSFVEVYRTGSGQAELHETQADIMIVESGAGTLVYGGQLVDSKTSGPNEVRGTSITGGMEKILGPGDVVSIPAKTPHLIKLDPGQNIAYITAKVTQ